MLKAGIMAEFGKVMCISTGYFYEDINKNICFKVKSICGDDEKEILQSFLQITNSFNKIDTLQWWKFGDYKNYISLNLLANILNVPTSKGDIDGSKVRDVYYEERNLERISTYCEKDVIVVANVILRFKNMPLLDAANVQIVK